MSSCSSEVLEEGVRERVRWIGLMGQMGLICSLLARHFLPG
jgi:hypothetical protein